MNLGTLINDGVRMIGQVYTAGHTGMLSGVQISVRSSGTGYRLRVAIHQAIGGLPTQLILGSTMLATSDSPFDSLVQFSPPVEQAMGRQYAIVVDYPDAPAHGPFVGVWDGAWADPNCYTGGTGVSSDDGIQWWSDDYDLLFRVFIKTK